MVSCVVMPFFLAPSDLPCCATSGPVRLTAAQGCNERFPCPTLLKKSSLPLGLCVTCASIAPHQWIARDVADFRKRFPCTERITLTLICLPSHTVSEPAVVDAFSPSFLTNSCQHLVNLLNVGFLKGAFLPLVIFLQHSSLLLHFLDHTSLCLKLFGSPHCAI